MARPPRDISVERLVSIPLLTYSYIIVGLAESLCCMGAYLWVFTHRGVKISDIFLLDPKDEQWFSDADRIDEMKGPAATGEFSPEDQERIVREVCPRSRNAAFYLILCFQFHGAQAVAAEACSGFWTNLSVRCNLHLTMSTDWHQLTTPTTHLVQLSQVP